MDNEFVIEIDDDKLSMLVKYGLAEIIDDENARLTDEGNVALKREILRMAKHESTL